MTFMLLYLDDVFGFLRFRLVKRYHPQKFVFYLMKNGLATLSETIGL